MGLAVEDIDSINTCLPARPESRTCSRISGRAGAPRCRGTPPASPVRSGHCRRAPPIAGGNSGCTTTEFGDAPLGDRALLRERS